MVSAPSGSAPRCTTAASATTSRACSSSPTRLIRWGAGTTVESAYRRALFGDQGLTEDEVARELADMQLVLADAGLDIAVVDVGTTMLRRAGFARVSVQLMGR